MDLKEFIKRVLQVVATILLVVTALTWAIADAVA